MADAPHFMPYSNHNGTNQQQQNTRYDNSSINTNQPQSQQQQPEEEDSPGQVKSLRPMLARGAACDTCRARKVKCDASRPYCSPCLKSARGNTTIAASKCAYEGTSVAIATANRAAEIQKQGGVKRKRRATKGGVKEEDGAEVQENRKRKKAPSAEEDERGDSRGSSRSLGEEEGFSQPQPQYPAQIPSVFMDPSSGYQVPLPSTSNSSADHSLPASYNRMQNSNHGNGPWQTTRPFEPAYPTPPSRYQMPSNSNGDRYNSSKLEEEANEAGGDKEQLADRVAELERQLKLQADSHAAALSAGRQPSQGPLAPPLPHAAFNSAYGSPAPGARSPSFPYATYSSYAPPPPSYGPYGSNYNNNGSPSSSSFPPGSGQNQNPLSHSTSSSSASVAANQYPPIQLPPPPNNASPYGSNPPLPLPLSHLQSQMNPIDNRRRSLSTLSAIAGAVSMEEYPPIGGSGTNSPLSTWSAHHLQGQESYGGGYRFSTSSPVSSTRHLGMSEPQAFALTSSTSSPGRTNWNPTTSSLRTSYENPPQDVQADQRIPTPPTAASSSNHSTSNSTSPSTTLPPSVEAGPCDPSISLNSSTNAANPIYYEPFDLGQSMFPLLDLSYPATLPPLSVLHHLISTFFKRAAVPSTMLSKAKLLFHLSLSPTDSRWPDEALLHAICAYACMYVSDESLGGGEYGGLGLNASGAGLGGMRMRYWEVEGDQSARDYHYKKAKVAIEEALSLTRGNQVGRNLFQVLQAVVLVCYVAYLSAQFTDLWLLAGTATRLIAPLGLNHLEPWDFDRNRSGPAYQDWGIRVRKTERNELLGPVKNLAEHWERSVTFWLAFAVDRFASANTDWTTSIDEKDISTHLPCTATQPMPGLSIDPQLCHIPSLYHGSPSFLEDTSAPIGSLGLYIKATILLGRVVNYTQRFPRYLMIPMGGSCSSIKRDIKATPEFVELDLAISKYKASNSANFFDNAGSSIDGFLASAYVIPHVATILLHETLTDRYDRTPQSSIQRCLVAAKCIINSTYILYQSSYDLGGVDPFLPFCWSVAGRALVRDFTTRQYWGETDEAASSRQLAEHCLSFTQHCAKQGSRIAQRLTETLEKHLENPESLLPLDAGCGVVFDLGDAAASHAYGMTEEERRKELSSMGSLPTYA